MSRFGSRTAGILVLACAALCASAELPDSLADGPAVPTNERGAAGLSRDEPAADSAVDLRPVLDTWGLSARSQGSRGTCSAFTVTQAIEYALGKNEQRMGRLSVEFLNWASNEAIGEKSDGGFFSDLWKGFEQYGICAEDQMPYAAAFDPDYRPSRAALDNARQLRAGCLQLHWIKPWDPNVGLNDEQFDAVKERLRERWPVCGGFLWPKQAAWVNGVLQMASRDNVRDGHSVLLAGFRDDPAQPGGGVFLVQNTSFGPRDAAMSYEYVRAYMNDAAWVGHDANPPSR